MLLDESGRRRRVLRFLGRAVSVLLLVWLGVLGLGALGLRPIGRVPVLGAGSARSAPPRLPARIEIAAGRARRAPVPVRPPSIGHARRTVLTPAPSPRRVVVGAATSPARVPGKTVPAASPSPGASASAPGHTGVTPSGKPTRGRSGSSAAVTGTPPGQAKKSASQTATGKHASTTGSP